jgi:DNA mismatch repair protein MutS
VTTPLRRQYLEMKARYPHAVLFFRMGDFYETFDADAELCARELEITLTSRPVSKGERVPLAGVPHHALDSYLARLIAKGYKVAVCEQTTAPTKGKPIVERDVVRVVTPGTLVEDNLLVPAANNYLAALAVEGGTAGLAWADVSTGEFACLQANIEAAGAELERLRPAELLLAPGAEAPPGTRATLTPLDAEKANTVRATESLTRHFEAPLEALGLSGQRLAACAAGIVVAYLAENQRAALGHVSRLEVKAAGGCMALDANARRNLEVFEPLRAGDGAEKGSPVLIGVLDETETPMGARLLRRWLGEPLLDPAAIEARLDAVQLFYDSAVRRGRAREGLGKVGDVERALARVSTAAAGSPGPSTPRDLLGLRRGLEAVPELRALLEEVSLPPPPHPANENKKISGDTPAPPAEKGSALSALSRKRDAADDADGSSGDDGEALALRDGSTQVDRDASAAKNGLDRMDGSGGRDSVAMAAARGNGWSGDVNAGGGSGSVARAAAELLRELALCGDTVSLIAAAVAEEAGAGAVIRAGFSEELDRLRRTARDARQVLAEIETRERERTGIKSLKVGYNRVFGYYIEVTKAHAGVEVPADYQRKQTLVNGERYTTPELAEHEYRVLHAQELEAELEGTLLRQVCAQVAAEGARILATARALARLDVAAALAEVAVRYGYARPVVDDGDAITVRDGRHPVVERMLSEGAFVPNDVVLSSNEAQLIVLTGPNMAGKSTYLRQVALIVLMAQAGSFVPAREARIGAVDHLMSRVGALDDIAAGHSTFMVEMLETAAMLRAATDRSLLIFDEIGRGTSTYDGMAIARAVAEYVHNRPDARARTLFATHYHELTELAETLPRVRNYNVAVAEEDGGVVFLRRILPGGADRSYGVHVGQLAGLPKPVVARAQELLSSFESEGSFENPRMSGGSAETLAQLRLFTQAEEALRKELAALNVNAMSPLEALNRLYELAERARRSS